MEFHDDYPQYEIMAHHGEEEGKKLAVPYGMCFGLC
jgi:hypothetical protein